MSDQDKKKGDLLITALGTSARETNYCLEQRTISAKLSPIALVKLLACDKRPEEIIALCTDKAYKETFPILKKEVDLPVKAVSIPLGSTKEELWEILHIILKNVPANSRLTLDLTQGLRSIPFLFFTAAMFLKALRNVQIKGVYYGMYEAQDEHGAAPMVDLNPILEMIEWFYATRMFKETGQAYLLSRCLLPFEQQPADLQGVACQPYSRIKGLRRSIDKVSLLYTQGLPIELGMESIDLSKKLSEEVPVHLREQMPLPEELFREINKFINPFVIHSDQKKIKNKTEVVLSEIELCRQACILDSYFQQGYINYALGLIREWIVSAVMLHRGYVTGREWLSYQGKHSREMVEGRLGALTELWKLSQKGNFTDKLTDGQRWLAEKWQVLSDYRNKLHHHGFRMDNVNIPQEKVKEMWLDLKNSLEVAGKWDVKVGGGGGRLLVSPLGLSKGLLYSALVHVKPDKLVVITSETAVANLAEITSKAGWSGEIEKFLLQDPFSGFKEADKLVTDLTEYLLDADEVIANITGGTTALQFIMQKVVERVSIMGWRKRLIAMVDRRSLSEQSKNPYVPGELIELDKDAGYMTE